MGDSTTAGTPAFKSPREAPPKGSGDETSQYAYWLMQAHPDWRVLNRGVNGERSDEIAARVARDVVAAQPEVVIVIAGVNDVYQGRSAGDVQRQLTAIYDAARDASIAIVAGSIIPYNTATPAQNAAMHAINHWIHEHAAAHADFKRAFELNPANIDAAREVRIHNMRSGDKPAESKEPSGGVGGFSALPFGATGCGSTAAAARSGAERGAGVTAGAEGAGSIVSSIGRSHQSMPTRVAAITLAKPAATCGRASHDQNASN